MKKVFFFAILFTVSMSFSKVKNEDGIQVFSPSPHYLYGAIRWDGWFDPSKNIDKYNLTNPEFSYRRPYYTTIDSQGRANICENKQAIMDQEIYLAAAAGLDYFAFLHYPNYPEFPDNTESYNYGLSYYKTSSVKGLIKFSLIVPTNLLTPAIWENEYLQKIISSVEEDSYLVEAKNSRPVIFFFLAEKFPELFPDPKTTISDLRDKVRLHAHGKNPWLVAMSGDPVGDAPVLVDIGFDAVTAYTAHGYYKTGLNQSYWNMMTSNSNFWERSLASGMNVVPIVNAGWDGTPRLPEYPIYLNHSFINPNAGQLAQNMQNAISFMQDHPGKTASNLVLIYAFNEFSEGGWLVPTENNYRLNYLAANVFGGVPMNKPNHKSTCP